MTKHRKDLYEYEEQEYVYTLVEERRDWRKHIEDYMERLINNAKTEIMGEENKSISDSTKEIKHDIISNNGNLLESLRKLFGFGGKQQ